MARWTSLCCAGDARRGGQRRRTGRRREAVHGACSGREGGRGRFWGGCVTSASQPLPGCGPRARRLGAVPGTSLSHSRHCSVSNLTFFLRMDFVTRQTGSVFELSVRCLQPLCWLPRGRVLVLLRSVSQVSSRGMNFTKAFIIKIFLMFFFSLFFLFFQGGCVPSGRRGADCLMAESLPLIDNVNSAEELAVTWRHQGRQTDANYSLSRRNI